MKRPAIMISYVLPMFVGTKGCNGGKLRRAANLAMDGVAVDDVENVHCMDFEITAVRGKDVHSGVMQNDWGEDGGGKGGDLSYDSHNDCSL